MCPRDRVWQQEKSEQCPMGRQILKKKRSAVVRLAPLMWRVSLRHHSVFVAWKILLFSFEATLDLVLSVVRVNDET